MAPGGYCNSASDAKNNQAPKAPRLGFVAPTKAGDDSAPRRMELLFVTVKTHPKSTNPEKGGGRTGSAGPHRWRVQEATTKAADVQATRHGNASNRRFSADKRTMLLRWPVPPSGGEQDQAKVTSMRATNQC